MKLGDWIAIFDEGARLVQYDTLERILADPANEFVENFIGSGAGLKQLTLTRVGEVPLAEAVTASPGDAAAATLNDALDTMLVSSAGAALVTGRRDVFEGVIDVQTIMAAITTAHAAAALESQDTPVGTNTGAVPASSEAAGLLAAGAGRSGQ